LTYLPALKLAVDRNDWKGICIKRLPMYASVNGVRMSMRDEYRTKAAEFQARARCESDGMTRLHFESLAKDYLQLAELAAQLDVIYKPRKVDHSRKPARSAGRPFRPRV
jgi:hypothetical protein